MVEPGQPAGTKLSGNQTRHMLKFAVRTPALNAQSVVQRGSRVLGFAGQNPTLVSSAPATGIVVYVTDIQL